MTDYKYIIIGNSAAAVGGVEGIRRSDKDGSILLISDEPHHTYSRPLISYYLEGRVAEKNIYYRDKDFYSSNNVTVKLGARVEYVKNNLVSLSDTTAYKFQKLLYAAGSRPFVPPIPGLDRVNNKFTFMDFDSARAISEKLKAGIKNVLIMGAGLIGLKAMEAVTEYENVSVTVADLASRVMPSVLNDDGSDVIKAHILKTKSNVRLILGAGVEKFDVQSGQNSAIFADDSRVVFDLLIIAVGVRPNVEILRDAGAKTDKGILTDEQQLTSLSNIYAAGDCTQSVDCSDGVSKIMALLPNAYFQGETAGISMAGGSQAETSAGLLPMNAIGFYGLHLISAGNGGSHLGKNESEYTVNDKDGYKRLVFKETAEGKVLTGYILIGKYVSRAGIYTSMIREKYLIPGDKAGLVHEKPQLLIFGKATRLQKLANLSDVTI
ncbi:NADH oxidase [Clostridia bacterium]|nr:NADH oxidase [Clostridia bacterium]